jgi:3D (Asp-Asp-Asp) domain-containing protein
LGVSVAIKKQIKMLNLFAVIADITLDSSYPTGGEPVTANQLGLNSLDFVLPAPAAGYLFEFDHTNSKLKAFTPVKAQAAHTHVFTGTAMTKTPTLIEGAEPSTKLLQNDAGTLKATDATAIPLGTPAGTNADGGAITASAATEVANTTDLHAVTVRVFAMGTR